MSFQKKVFLVSEDGQKKSWDYDEIGEFENGFAPVRNAKDWGFIDEEFEEIVCPKYDAVLQFDEQGLAAVRNHNHKWGFITTRGEEICKLQYDNVWKFSPEGIALVRIGNSYGYINASGEETCEVKYSMYSSGTLLHIYGLSAEEISSGERINPVQQNLLNPWWEKGIGLEVIRLGDKEGLVNKFGKVVVEPQYDDIALTYYGEPYSVQKGKKYGFINSQGDIVIPLEYDSKGEWITENAMSISKDGKFGIIDRTGKVLCPFKYEKIYRFIDEFAVVEGKKGLGFINKRYEEICKPKYASAYPFDENGFARVTTYSGTRGYINTNGKFFKKLPAETQ